MKNNWLALCFNMMCEYIPQELSTSENYNKFQGICDHFISVSTALSAKIKADRNISELMIDESEDTKKAAQIIKRLARQNFEYMKHWLIEEGLYAKS